VFTSKMCQTNCCLFVAGFLLFLWLLSFPVSSTATRNTVFTCTVHVQFFLPPSSSNRQHSEIDNYLEDKTEDS